MAAPSKQKLLQWVVPAGEAQVQYSPQALAYEIDNFEQTTDGTLRTISGPCPYEINREGHPTNPGNPYTFGSNLPLYGIFQASLLGGAADLLVVRAGEKLFMHKGWEQGFSRIQGGLSAPYETTSRYASEPTYPDSFVVMNEAIIWSNGIDHPRLIDHHGNVEMLGFDETPASLFVEGPQSVGASERKYSYPNSEGYSWPGRIGTPGDLLAIDGGGLMAGEWLYYVQYEDRFGNLSGTSAASNPVKVDTHMAQPLAGSPVHDKETGGDRRLATEIDDLMRQFLVRAGGEAPEQAVAVRIYRTPDIKNIGSRPQFLARIPGNREFAFPDGTSDAELGSEMVATVPTPRYRVACTHQGRLVVANLVGAPGMVRRSNVGSAGTFPAADFVFPDSGGAEVTAVTSHDGVLLAFTESSVYSLEDFGQPRPMAQGVGCVAPQSVRALPDGTLVWLGRDGFYGMKGGSIGRISGAIDRTIKHYVNKSRMVQATAAIHPITGEYRCAVAPSGESHSSLVLCFDGSSWRRINLNMHIASMCNTKDWRRLMLFLGVKKSLAAQKYDSSHDTLHIAPSVYVMDREIKDWLPPTRSLRYRSGWLRGDDTGLTQTNIRTMYVGLTDAWDGNASIRFYKNGSWKDVIAQEDLRLIGTDDGSDVVTDIAGSAVIGTAAAHQPRMFWRQVPVGMENVNSWAFEISAESPTKIQIAAFAFDVSIATGGNVRGRVPRKDDL